MPPQRRASDDRSKLIGAVKSPLGFFTLALLVSEAMFAVAYASSPNSDKRFLFGGMLGVVLAMVVLVGVMAWLRPDALSDARPTRSVQAWRQELRKGDHVQIVTPPATITTASGIIEWTRDMAKFSGKRAQIVEVEEDPTSYRLDVDAQLYSWAPNWLEPVD